MDCADLLFVVVIEIIWRMMVTSPRRMHLRGPFRIGIMIRYEDRHNVRFIGHSPRDYGYQLPKYKAQERVAVDEVENRGDAGLP